MNAKITKKMRKALILPLVALLTSSCSAEPHVSSRYTCGCTKCQEELNEEFNFIKYNEEARQKFDARLKTLTTQAAELVIEICFITMDESPYFEKTIKIKRTPQWDSTFEKWKKQKVCGLLLRKEITHSQPYEVSLFKFYDAQGNLLFEWDNSVRIFRKEVYKNESGTYHEMMTDIYKWDGVPDFDKLYDEWIEQKENQ